MRRLKLELQKTMEMYSTACKEALSAKQKVQKKRTKLCIYKNLLIAKCHVKQAAELHRWRIEEEKRLKVARLAEEAEKNKSDPATAETNEASQTNEALSEEVKNKATSGSNYCGFRYRRYTIEDIEAATENLNDSHKIGEGGYGPVYKCYLDHTSVAVKVLRPDATQGRSQFQQEVKIRK